MSYVALYRKYRPKTFSEVVGQDIVVRILKNSISSNKIGHAYIFSGTRGTGKTSVAKIFSRAVNCLYPVDGDVCLKCDVCKNINDNCIDIVEIDAASNNGVDEIREIRNNVTLMPTYLKYKVYIIDEVHMLSGSAFNALLKTLEEPPEHVIFILATTELGKIPATVLSRCQKLDFKKIPSKVLAKQINYILKKENKKMPDDVVNLISELSDGSFRDAINLVDQLLAFEKSSITVDDVFNIIGDIPEDKAIDLIKCITEYDIKKCLELVNSLYEEGKNFYNISDRMQNVARDIIVNNNTHEYFKKDYEKKLEIFTNLDNEKCIEFSNYLFDLTNILKKTSNQKTLFETYMIKCSLLFSAIKKPIKELIVPLEKKENVIEEENVSINDNNFVSKKVRINNTLAEAGIEYKKVFINKFGLINDFISNIQYSSVSSLILKGKPEVVSDKNVLFTFKNIFEVVLFDKNADLIQKMLKEIYSKKYDIVGISEDEWKIIRNKFIEDKKNGIVYNYIKEDKKNKKKNNVSALENEAESVFGEDIISVE